MRVQGPQRGTSSATRSELDRPLMLCKPDTACSLPAGPLPASSRPIRQRETGHSEITTSGTGINLGWPLGLTLHHPSAGVCVVAVDGELDMLTAPVLDSCLRQQLAAIPRHLVVDLQLLRFLGVSGLSCLMCARELAQQTARSQLHLTGLADQAVARPVELTRALRLFDSYPTVADALVALTNGAHPVRRARRTHLATTTMITGRGDRGAGSGEVEYGR